MWVWASETAAGLSGGTRDTRIYCSLYGKGQGKVGVEGWSVWVSPESLVSAVQGRWIVTRA